MSFPEGTPGKNTEENSLQDASATADARGAVRSDNPSGGGTSGEWLERQPISSVCECPLNGKPDPYHGGQSECPREATSNSSPNLCTPCLFGCME